jgi:Oxygenase domain of the 2OGFeDO superfamily
VILQLRSRAPAVEALLGKRASPGEARLFVDGDAKLYKPDGQPLLVLRKAAISQEAADAAYPFLRAVRNYRTDNRGNFAAEESQHVLRRDGVRSRSHRSGKVPSAVGGSLDRYARIPFCRQSFFSTQHPAEWAACLPVIQEVAAILRRELPDRYAAQAEAASRTHPAYVIPGTPFTTLTVNNTWAGGYHRDAGDFKPGFGVMCVFRKGVYTGGELVLPAFGVGVDLGDRDVVLFDVHEVHGNTPIVGAEPAREPAGHERISVVFYFREKMVDCLSPAEELEHAKRLRGDLTGAV